LDPLTLLIDSVRNDRLHYGNTPKSSCRRGFELPAEPLVRVSVCFLYRQRLVGDEAKIPLLGPHWPSKIASVDGLSFCGVYSATRRHQKPAQKVSIPLDNQNNGSMLEG
jgi:hypothetical protein